MTTEAARIALRAGDFSGAAAALADGEGEGTADWLELRAEVAYGTGEYEEAVATWERLHVLHRTAGERVLAARAAVMAAIYLLIDAGLLSAVRGWVRRAQRLLEGESTTPVHALIAAVLGYERLFSGDPEAAGPLAAEAIRLGEQLDVVPAVAIGRTATARIAVLCGDVDGGLAQLDEVAALLMSGEVDDLTTGMMFCELICAAQGLARPDLAREWTEAMERWSVTGAVGGIRGRCRVHQAELLRLTGPCDAAEREALQACEELRPWMRREYGWPLVELGMTRLRRGDLSGAEEAFVAAADHAWPPHPGLALLRLEQGDVPAAAREIASAISNPIDAPSKELPPFGDLRLAPLLDAQAEIAAALGDLTVVSDAAEGLARASETFRSPALAASAELAKARLAVVRRDADTGVSAAGSAVAMFAELDAPYDTARARTVLAEALALRGDGDAASRELTSARAEYLRYGAALRAAVLDRQLEARRLSLVDHVAAPRHGVFRRDGESWEIALAGQAAQIADLKGMRYLQRLLAEPGREFHVLDLVAVETGTIRPSGVAAHGLPVLDDAAREAYRRRLADIDEDIEDATRLNDLGRLAKAESDRQYLVNELTRAVGIGARMRRTGDPSERARTAVARTLRYTFDEIRRRHPPIADHLRSSIRTGTYCVYRPDPLATVAWTLSAPPG